MSIHRRTPFGPFSGLAISAVFLGGFSAQLPGACGPFSDVAADAFCPFVLEIFYLGITTGTTPATYDPSAGVTRLQMAAFLSRTVDSTLKRGSRRAALNQMWITQNVTPLSLTTVGNFPRLLQSDGSDVWVGNSFGGTISRVRGSDARLLETWTGADLVYGVVVAMSRVLGVSQTNPGRMYMIDPSQPAGAVTTVASNLGVNPIGAAYDGVHVWTANQGPSGSVSIVTPGASIPWPSTTLSVGLGMTEPLGILFDGANIWVTDLLQGTLLKLDGAGAILQTVTVGSQPGFPAFDGTSVWVPNANSSSVSVVRASTGAVLQTLTGNGLDHPYAVAFDGERILATNLVPGTASLWKAADFTPLGSFALGGGTSPAGACSDGIHFWIALQASSKIVRF